jgi:GT2 family glycosyltransferase
MDVATSMPNIWIVVVNYNGLDDTCKCLHSLRQMSYGRFTTVVVDNASAEDPLPALRDEFPECCLVRNRENQGWAGGNNTGIRRALDNGAEQVVLLNNDTTVAPQLIERLRKAAAAHPRFGVIGPVIRFMDEPDLVMTDGCSFNDAESPGFLQRRPVPLAAADPPAVTEVDIVNGCCMMVAAAVFRRVGLIDERFFLVHEESDLCLRARRAGFACGVIGEALVRHKGSSAFKRTGKKLQRYYDARNLLLLLRKHPPTGPRQRGPGRSRWEYLKYVYYRYALEREQGQVEAADAVLQGLSDALAGRFGVFEPRGRPAVPVLRWVFESYRQWRMGHQGVQGGTTRADLVR